MRRLPIALLLIASATTSARGQQIAAAPPPAEESTFAIPIHASLAPLLPQIEAQVPTGMAKLDAYEMDKAQQYGVKYKVARDPITLNMQGTGLHATTTVRYALEGCRRTYNPVKKEFAMWPCISCGFGEPMREAFIAIHAVLSWDPNWRLRSRTTARPAEFPKPCGVTMLNVNVSDRYIAPIVDQQLQEVVKTIDRNTPRATDLKPNAQQIWSALQAPNEIAPRTWLIVEPLDFAVGGINGSGLNVSTIMTLRAHTRVIVGDRPLVVPKPLPPLRTAAPPATGGIRVPFDVELSYPDATALLAQSVAGQKLGDTTLESIRLLPGTNGKLMLEAMIDYHASRLRKYHGLVYLEGMPRYDAATSSVVVDQLDYSLDPKRHNPFVKLADHLAHDSVRAQLVANAHWSIAPQMAAMRAEITKAMSRPLAPNVILRGSVDAMQPVSVTPLPDRMVIRAVAVGSAAIDVK